MVQIYGSPASGDAFTDRRRTGIGGSDAGAIIGVSPFASALSVWEAKRGIQDQREPSERMLWGSRLERAVLDGYALDNRRYIRKGTWRRHPDLPFIVGHPDALAADRVVEVKVTSHLGESWGEDGSAEVPPHYFAQVQHYMILTGLPLADLAALVGGRELHVYTIPADEGFQTALIAEEQDFWRRVVEDDPPDPDGSASAGAALKRMFPRAFPEEVVATPEIVQMVESYLTAKGMRDIAQQELDRWAQLIQRYMGERERLIGPGFVASWANRAGSTRWQEVAAAFRDLLVPHLADDELDRIQDRMRGEPTRTFRLTRKAGD